MLISGIGNPRSSFFEPLRYLTRDVFRVDANSFERTIDLFMSKVVARLAERRIETPLQSLWQEIIDERADSETSVYRRMEAILGYDPDVAEAALIETFLTLRAIAGSNALDEIAYASSNTGRQPETLNRTVEVAAKVRVEGKVVLPTTHARLVSKLRDESLPPWEIGRRLADEFRRHAGDGSAPVSNRDLGEFFGMSPTNFQTHEGAGATPPVGLAVVHDDGIGLALRKPHETGKRFEATRLLGDFILNGSKDTWLPVTDTSTFRQKVQRAFAAQFLVPIDALLDRLDGKITEESVVDAASHFNVSPFAVQSHLVNNQVPGATLREFATA